jgi:chromosome segregation ATPase
MALSSSNTQTRELTELRNHLKWLDEERRKIGRKTAELEQRLAQQGRELAERDQKIQELEWHVANFAERFERLSENAPDATAQQQRLQDMEWHLSNLSAQLARQPNPEEERARLREETIQALAATQTQLQAEHAQFESRLVAQLAALQKSVPTAQSLENSLLPLATRQEQQIEALGQIEHRLTAEIAGLRDADGRLAAQFEWLRETMPAPQSIEDNILPLLSRQEEQTEALGQIERRLTAEIAGLRDADGRLTAQFEWLRETMPAPQSIEDDLLPLRSRQEEQAEALAEVDRQVAALGEQLRERTIALAAESQTNFASLAARVQEHIGALAEEYRTATDALAEQYESRIVLTSAEWQERFDALAARGPDVPPEFLRFEERLSELSERLAPLADHQGELAHLLTQVDERTMAALERLPQVDVQLAAYEEQTAALQAQLAQLEESVAKVGNIREVMPLFTRLEQELELRQAEEVRLANLISAQEGRFVPLNSALTELRDGNVALLSRLSDVERMGEELRRGSQEFNEHWKPVLTEIGRRVGPLGERLTVLNNNILKAEASLQTLAGDQTEMRELLTNLAADHERGQAEVGRQIEAWQTTIDEHKDTIERFTQQWITLSNQYKEARMAVQNFAHWQKQLEQQKREAAELLRVESNRMQGRWEGFLVEVQEKLKNFELELGQKWQTFELENEQKWVSARRSEQLWREELSAVDELIQKLQQDNRNLIWRVQAAQADAIKKWPRLLMEEVEKAVELNPSRRLATAGGPTRADMSVVDAIEQGLIKIDYSEDSGIDL